MPTGYTAGIIDGTTKTFEQFAKQCARNFGAMIMMRDEPLDAPWKPREPSDYHTKEMARAKRVIEYMMQAEDDDIVADRYEELIKSRDYHADALEKERAAEAKLKQFLAKAKAYQSPSTQHDGIKAFMIKQIEETIDFDCNHKYHTEALSRIEEGIKTLNANTVRSEALEKAERDLAYHTTEYKKDVAICNESNEWVRIFFESIEGVPAVDRQA